MFQNVAKEVKEYFPTAYIILNTAQFLKQTFRQKESLAVACISISPVLSRLAHSWLKAITPTYSCS